MSNKENQNMFKAGLREGIKNSQRYNNLSNAKFSNEDELEDYHRGYEVGASDGLGLGEESPDYSIDEIIANNPPPRKRKHITLWQAYLQYNEILELRKKHILRISAIDRNMSEMDKDLEKLFLSELQLDTKKKLLGRQLINYGTTAGPIWNWATDIRGLGNGLLAAQLIAQIDDIGRFDTISKLWRFCGYAVIDGRAEKNQRGDISHYNRRLKGVCFNIAQAFIKSQSAYVDIYYHWKKEYKLKYPIAICKTCSIECDIKIRKKKGEKYEVFVCPNNSKHKKDYSDSHIHYRAIRKMIKVFLKDLWLAWREYEGLPISEKWEDRIS